MSLLDFTLKTYKRKKPIQLWAYQDFVPYLEGLHKEGKGRLICPQAQVVVLELIGGWPPASDDEAKGDLYKASMLLMFKPWRDIGRLKEDKGSFVAVFGQFEKNMSDKVRVRLENIQAFYDCDPDGIECVEPWQTIFG